MIETAVKERPILFSGEMVRAILEGRKTMTRRVFHAMAEANARGGLLNAHDWYTSDNGDWWCDESGAMCGPYRCPYGRPGERLWVRETWAPIPNYRPIANPSRYDGVKAFYRADNDRPMWDGSKWKPSIHMPRWASRLTLEITAVRVERLQAITDADARSEGCLSVMGCNCERNVRDESALKIAWCRTCGGGCFWSLWDQINMGRGYGWEVNPWVWVVSFRKVVRDAE